jgi:hypothetical protein
MRSRSVWARRKETAVGLAKTARLPLRRPARNYHVTPTTNKYGGLSSLSRQIMKATAAATHELRRLRGLAIEEPIPSLRTGESNQENRRDR